LYIENITFSIPSGSTGYVLPPVFGVSLSGSSSNPATVAIYWWVNSVSMAFSWGFTGTNGYWDDNSFGTPIWGASGATFFQSSHTGPVTYLLQVSINNPSGAPWGTIYVQNAYMNVEVVQT
jgi:hypothetical protein